MIASLILILTFFSSGVLSFDSLWPFYDYHYYSPDLKRNERGPPEWARGHGKKNGHGPPFGQNNKHGHGPPDFPPGHNRGHGHGLYRPDGDSSEEFLDYIDNHKFTTTERPPTPLSTIALPSTSTDYTGLIDIRFKPVEDRNKRSKGTDPSTEIQDVQNTQDIQKRNSLGFHPWHHGPPNSFKSYYPFYPPRLATCVKKFDCIPMHECKNPPRRDFEFGFCKWVNDEPYVCCERTKSKQQNTLKCGSKKTDTEFSQALIGGTPVEEGTAYPWMVAIGESTKNGSVDWYCGGALIGENTVITAAHCVSRRNANIIRIGEIDLSIDLNNDTSESNMQQIGVCRTLIHPLYRSPLLYNDIALLYLEDSVEISPYASPICLPQKFSIAETPVALLTGWGQLSFATDRSDNLQEVTLKVFNNSYCDEQYALTQASKRFFPRGILDSQLCAGDESGGKDACQGDSGAPLVANQDGNFVLIGTVSAGIGCGSQTFPGVYTRISSFTPWIFQNII